LSNNQTLLASLVAGWSYLERVVGNQMELAIQISGGWNRSGQKGVETEKPSALSYCFLLPHWLSASHLSDLPGTGFSHRDFWSPLSFHMSLRPFLNLLRYCSQKAYLAGKSTALQVITARTL
jgi:hypothetical protein